MSTVRRTFPSTPGTFYSTMFPRIGLYDTACSSRVAGSRLGWAVYPPNNVPQKSDGPTVSNSSVSSYGRAPPSTMASVLPPCPMMLVLEAKSKPPLLGPLVQVSPSFRETSADRTHRLRYQCAFPSRSRKP